MSLLITTTSNIEGRRFVRYLRLVTGEASAKVQPLSAVSGTAVVTGDI